MALPLEGIKVVDMAQVYFGPGGAMYLADQGANVIKVEPSEGDASRSMFPSGYAGYAKPHLSLNRNKRSIVVDIKHSAGLKIIYQLAQWADVFITNFRPGAAERAKVDYDTLANYNSRLVYAAVSALGPRGAEAHLPGYDTMVQARAGMLGARRMPDGTPVMPLLTATDMAGTILVAYSVMVALWERQKTGRGQKIELSLLDAAIALQIQQLVRLDGESGPLPGDNLSPVNYCYRCHDGEYVNIVLVTDRQWEALCRGLGMEDLLSDVRFKDYGGRGFHFIELKARIQQAVASMSGDQLMNLLKEVDVPAGLVRLRAEIFDDPQVVANQMMVHQEHPVVGGLRMGAVPFRLSGSTEQQMHRPAPALGQHTDEILTELGYYPEEISVLRSSKAVE
jgi:crotonobetainyl-CoA:carnitine CoA-transferase CaiB-like acyl-CoA transferase